MPRQKSLASVGVSLPTFAFVLTRSPVFPFVMPGLDSGIHVESTPAQRTPPALAGGSLAWTTGIGVRRTPFCERLDESETVACHGSGAAMRRENEIFSPPAHVRAARGGEGLGVGGTSVRPPPRLISLT